jgi:hypothetical protein
MMIASALQAYHKAAFLPTIPFNAKPSAFLFSSLSSSSFFLKLSF